MDLQMTGMKAIVTGASAGIGKAVTRSLASEGVDVAICARHNGPLEKAAAEIAKETGRKIVPVVADLTKPADAENFVKQAHAALGRIDILVINAGSAPGGVIEHLSEEEWASALQLKFMGYVRCMKHVLPIMQKQKKGRVGRGRQPGDVPRLRSRLLRQRHHDRDRRRAGKAADGSAARPLSGIASRGPYWEVSEPRHDLRRQA